MRTCCESRVRTFWLGGCQKAFVGITTFLRCEVGESAKRAQTVVLRPTDGTTTDTGDFCQMCGFKSVCSCGVCICGRLPKVS